MTDWSLEHKVVLAHYVHTGVYKKILVLHFCSAEFTIALILQVLIGFNGKQIYSSSALLTTQQTQNPVDS